MRIAYITHFYPPTPAGGVGHYTATLAEAFVRAGASVGVLCANQWGEGSHYLNGTHEETRQGVFVRRLDINWRRGTRPTDWLYDSPPIGDAARQFFVDFQPDVVHVTSCYTLSIRPLLVAKVLGLPVIFHLHDYWLVCVRVNLLHHDNTICTGPDSAWKCQQCLLQGSRVWALASHTLPEACLQPLFEQWAKVPPLTRFSGLAGRLGDLGRRREILLQAAMLADKVVVLTDFASRLLQDCGVPAARVHTIPNGIDTSWRSDLRPIPSSRVRIGFLGSVISIKGVHLLVQAFRQLLDEGRPVELQIWGGVEAEPAYVEQVKALASGHAFWGGAYGPGKLAAILSNLDVVVVPSICYEVRPLVIQEAYAAGLPVIVSAKTSAAEAVTHNKNGLHFRQGSVDDLACQLRRLFDEPGLLSRLAGAIGPVRSVEDDVDTFASFYAELLERRSPDPSEKTTVQPMQ